MSQISRTTSLGASPLCVISRPTCRCCTQSCSAQRSDAATESPEQQAIRHKTHLILNSAGLLPLLCCFPAAASEVAEQAAQVLIAAQPGYTPSPMEVPSWEIWAGFVAGVVPFIIASYEFGKRIVIQRRCPECQGRGLVQRGRVLKKCTQCGGMLPWLGWRMFLFSTFTSPGNGGPLLQPKGQKSVFYSMPPPLPPKQPPTAGTGEEQGTEQPVSNEDKA